MVFPLSSRVGDVVCLPLKSVVQQTADNTSICSIYVPFKCRVVAISGGVDVIGGSTKPTDYDIMVKKGSTNLLSSRIDAVGSSTNNGPQAGTLVTSPSVLALAEGDTLVLDGDITGGSSPTVDGVWANVIVARE